jgi:GTP-binding protein HflX
LFDRPEIGERAIIVHLAAVGGDGCGGLSELQELAASAGAHCVGQVCSSRTTPDSRFFVGSGKVEEIRAVVARECAELVIVNHDLSPSQERNLESFLRCRVIGRTGLILDIFAQRARSFEGKLQVELAQLKHLSSRLVRGWTHLERQKGGIGLRGPGETQLETDRRLLGKRIKQIVRQLRRVDKQRNQGRHSRRKAGVVSVSLVGYTNAGKSTLFNALTQANVHAADQLFATLDPTLRRLETVQGDAVVIADTVGFISDLPHELIAAFRSTLQETCEADLILHVIDASNPRRDQYIEQVEDILVEIGADRVPRVRVYNKIDLMAGRARVERDEMGRPRSSWVSAATGAGLSGLREIIAEGARGETVHGWVCLPPVAGRLRARLFSLGAVVNEQLNPNGEWLIEVHTSRKNLQQLCCREGFKEEWMRLAS